MSVTLEFEKPIMVVNMGGPSFEAANEALRANGVPTYVFPETAVKALEAIEAIEDGASEIDLVINIGALKNKDYEYIKEEIEEIRDSIDGKTLKVIVETCYLNEAELKKMVEICNETFVSFIKTSTGYGTRGVSLKDIDIINKYKEEFLEIKASGGIRDIEMVNNLLDRGVTRLGMSNIDCLKGSKE